MTLEMLENALSQLKTQLKGVIEQTAPEKPVIQHCNAIELLGAIQFATQLVQLETVAVKSPPGATGPVL